MGSFQELDIVVDVADYHSAVLSILAAIRPQWKEEDICMTLGVIVLSCFCLERFL